MASKRTGMTTLCNLKEISRKKQVIKEKEKFAVEFIAKMNFLFHLKKFYFESTRYKKKCFIADSLNQLHLKRKIFIIFVKFKNNRTKKQNSLQNYAYRVKLINYLFNNFIFLIASKK